ncbi:MAG: hypothetical protein H6757_01410 [Candidatus Omnitrophica bacterium]|nr:hypothetical protein [Candidatus Omnitrophota bacterium]
MEKRTVRNKAVRGLLRQAFVFIMIMAACAVLSSRSHAAESAACGPEVSKMGETVKRLEEKLDLVLQNQSKIMDAQKELSAEHEQLRYWIHRR